MSKEENNKKLLKDLGFKISSKGFKYWLVAIEIHKKNKWKASYSMQELLENFKIRRIDLDGRNQSRRICED